MQDMKLQNMKLQNMKRQDMKLQDMKLQDMTRIDRILFNFSFFFLYCDADVAAMELSDADNEMN